MQLRLMQDAKPDNDFVHPEDWRNIPKCVQSACIHLMRRSDAVDNNLKQYQKSQANRINELTCQVTSNHLDLSEELNK